MPINSSKTASGTKLFQQDIVQKISSPEYTGIVLRCWHDAEEQPSIPHVDPLMRPLSYGEVGVSFISHGGKREILLESELRLVDRTLQPGDYCKRSFDDVRAGVVTNITTKGRLAHAISDERVDGWLSLCDLQDRVDPDIGDYIAYDDWIGQVIEVFDEYIVQLSTGQLVRLPELGSRLNVGESGPDILPAPVSEALNLPGVLRGAVGGGKDTVIAVKHNAYAITWLALNQSLPPAASEQKPRPKQFWFGEDLCKLTLIRGPSDLEMRVGDRVRLKNVAGLPTTQHGQESDPTGVVQVQMFVVKETATDVDILWQDGTRETLKSREVIPYLNPDEYDCWPGDHVVWNNEGERRSAIVQSVDAVERTALILFADTGTIELASLLELDPHGNSDQNGNVLQSHEVFGVRRGDFVFIHAPGSSNGMEPPKVPRIGEIEPWVREQPFIDGEFSGWRKTFQETGIKIAAQRSPNDSREKPIQRPVKEDGKLSWCGEVTGLNLDGTVQITHPDFTIDTYSLESLTRLYDGMEQLEDEGWDDASEHYNSDDDDEQTWAMDEDGFWQPEHEGDDWAVSSTGAIIDVVGDVDHFDDDDMESMDHDYDQEMGHEDIWSSEASDSCVHEEEQITISQPKASENNPPVVTPAAIETDTFQKDDSSESFAWNRFEILSSAPVDHAFFSSPHAQPSKSFLGRLRREYRVLDSSLPESIIVRAYEDRTDLLRTLIIGPESTPYADAPFVIDWMLDSNFPHSPPIAHFLSWTNGNGRVNPNLYEEGKVCLSILGTWTGDKTEVWSAARSSLLQALVSIQGLVLVKEPWFCEPAYDKLRGTEEGTVNSRLYSEKAYVLSRGFVRRALEIPLGGLEAEIAQLYYNNGRLQKVVDDAQRLIQKSRDNLEVSKEDQDLAVPRLTAGGIIALERVLARLQRLLQNSSVNTVSTSHSST